MIDIKAGNNLMLLPLDKIIDSKNLKENIENEDSSDEYISSETNNREGR
jgi:hypothetical protein